MTVLWVIAGAALVAAVAALVAVRRARARLDQLSDAYWELKYQYLELRKLVDRTQAADPSTLPTPAPPPPKESFVPLTSLRR